MRGDAAVEAGPAYGDTVPGAASTGGTSSPGDTEPGGGNADRGSFGPAPPAVSLPTGGGAIRGIGEKFAANPVTGAATLRLPLGLPEGRDGLCPPLSFGYDSTAGNGPFGFGWQLAVPAIAQRTDKGVPRYGDDDVYVLSGAEDLVSVPEPDQIRSGHAVRRYRPRIEGPFTRIERWTRLADGDVHWRTIAKDNVMSVYGADAASRIADPADPRLIFSWLLCARYDDRGNAEAYSYAAEDDTSVDTTAAHERNRAGLRGANRYLKRVRYGNRTPLLLDVSVDGMRRPHLPAPETTGAGWMFEVVFDYGEGHETVAPPDAEGRVLVTADPGTPAGPGWPVRSDPFSRYRSGFEVRTYRLCQAVLVFHRFPDELGVEAYLTRAVHFGYTETPYGSFVSDITTSGYARQSDGRYLRRSLPALSFEYAGTPLAQAGDVAYEVTDVAGADNLPAGVDGNAYRWVDLDGEGIAGVLATETGGWRYKPNLGAGRLGPMGTLARQPAAAGAGAPATQLVDLDGDGAPNLVVFSPDGAGSYERDGRGWTSLRPFRTWPRLSFSDGSVRLIDVTGDGLADVLVAGDGYLTWYGSRGPDGFAPAVRVPVPADDERGPRVVFADGTWSVHLADLSGDGLSDIVRIGNGDVCYWPNLGYGRFGAKVTMDNAPRLDHPDQFDARRVRFADTDGSGTSDLIYLGRDGVRVYLNGAGNVWSAARTLIGLPTDLLPGSVAVVDLLGRGTACLVWASPLPAAARQPIRYVDLAGGHKPHLLTEIRNGLGARTVIGYTASTEFYLADKAAGRPWATRLPFPVHVVSRVDTFDHIGRSRFCSRYAYHHGHFDAGEREWRGFGRVDQFDTEEYAALAGSTDLPAGSNVDASSHVPPVETRSWHHTGAYLEGGRISRHLADEYYAEPDSILLDDTVLPAGLTAAESVEACRALKGLLLRREVYARDGTEAQDRPYTVSEHNYTIRPLQPRVFMPHPRETVQLHYERRLYPVGEQLRADPRTSHELTLEVDDFGSVLLAAVVAYGRRHPDPDPRLTDADRAVQVKSTVVCAAAQVTSPVDGPDVWRIPQPSRRARYELYGAVPAGRLFGFDELRAIVDAASDGAHDLPHEDVDGTGATGGAPWRRVVESERITYRRNDLTGPLPDGQVESLALPFAGHRLALTDGLAATAYGGQLGPADLAAALTGAGYVRLPATADWWTPSRRVGYSPGADPAAVELAEAGQHFFRERRFVDPFGNATIVDYDAADLFAEQTRDPLDNVETYLHNYRVLRASRVTDANGNRRAVAFDALGLVVGTAVMGKVDETLGDSLVGFVTDLTDAIVAAHMADPKAVPPALLGRATTRIVYDLHAFARTGTDPVVASTLAREMHDAEPEGPTSAVRCHLSYSDGFGSEVQRRLAAESGQWLTSGWTVRNNKGKPVRRYEPFLDGTHAFTFGTTSGVSPIMCYDPLLRLVAVVQPDHAWRKARFDAWGEERWDLNDTVLISDPATDPDAGAHLARLPIGEYQPTWYTARAGGALGPAELDAAAKAATHAATPALTLVDPRGRTFGVVDHNRVGGLDEYHRTRQVLDVAGNRRFVVDALARVAARSVFDLAGNALVTGSMEAGQRRALYDVNGEPVRRWDGRGHVFVDSYDALRRPVQRTVRGTDPDRSDPRTLGADVVYERFVYGEGQPEDAARNLRTRLAFSHDGAGVDAVDRYDFKGNPLHQTRQVTADHRALPDWSGNPALEPDVWHNRTTYDAFNRPVALTTPDGSVTRVSYSPRGLVAGVDVGLRGDSVPTTFVTSVRYNARGQETEVDLANGASVRYEYNPFTFRPTRVTATRPAAGDALATQLFADATRVQDLRYTHDPCGNTTRLVDAALRTLFHDNAQVEPVHAYAYDAVYRLVEATGREHAAQVTDLAAVRAYTQSYSYDPAGNLTSVAHAVAGGGWTRTYAYSEPSQLDAAVVSNRLSATTGPAGTETYAYDEHGCLTGAPHLSRLDWDFKGQLVASSRQVTGDGVGQEMTYYTYSGGGQRVLKVTERATGTRRTTRLYLRGSERYLEYDGAGTGVTLARETLHVMAATRRVALVDTLTVESGQTVAPNPVIRYQLGDQLDSVTVELDAAGAMVTFEEFTPYGPSAYQAGSAAEVSRKRYRYTGRERDEETGFGYHGARYYAPLLGRWTSCDPAGLVDGPNLYRYARDNPVRMRDPSGTQSTDDESHRVPDAQPAQTLAQERPPDGDASPATPTEAVPPDGRGGGRLPAGEQAREEVSPATQVASASSGSGGGDQAATEERRTTSDPPPSRRPTHLEVGEGFSEVTKVHWHHWPGTRYYRDTGEPVNGPTWLTWIAAGLYLIGMGVLVVLTGRTRDDDPDEYKILKYGATALLGVMVATRLTMEATVSKVPEGQHPPWDDQPVDPWWTPIHTMTGVVMGLWQVPFPLVAAATIGWEIVEITAPGFGDHEINSNRLTDIGVAWAGWATAAGLSSWLGKTPFPFWFGSNDRKWESRF